MNEKRKRSKNGVNIAGLVLFVVKVISDVVSMIKNKKSKNSEE